MTQKNLFSIGEVSKMFHISVSTLHHYENIGLLKPEYIDSNSGYRYYGTSQFEVLNTIRYLRALDMPLNEIKDFLKNKDIDLIEEKLRRQKEFVLKKQNELKRIEHKIDHRLNQLNDAQNVPIDIIELIKLKPCRIAWADNRSQIKKSADMETPIRKLDKSDAEAVIFFGKVGLAISKEHLKKDDISQYDGIFFDIRPRGYL